MRHSLRLFLILSLLALCIACGGRPSTINNNGVPPVDPSGNWSLQISDSSGNTVFLSALFNQTGADVHAINLSTGDTTGSTFACQMNFADASMTSGLVSDGTHFTGIMNWSVGSWTFSTQLAPDGKSFTGTYSGLPACAGLESAGTFAGQEVPSISAAWTGTIQLCTFEQDGSCPIVSGNPLESLTFVLAQDDATGAVTGSYEVNASGLSSGTVALREQDVLSGRLLQFSLLDSDGNRVAIVDGFLDQQSGFSGVLVTTCCNTNYQLTMSHQ
jgi:hypothetical protein